MKINYSILFISIIILSNFSLAKNENKKIKPNKPVQVQVNNNIKDLANPEEFQEFINKDDKPIIIKFYTPWCPACKRAAPIVKDVADLFKDKVYFAKVDVTKEKFKSIADSFGVNAVPTFVIKKTGIKNKEDFIVQIKSLLGEKSENITEQKTKNNKNKPKKNKAKK